MPCPRCAGFAERIDWVSEEGRLVLDRCVNCGHVFGESLLDHHHALTDPPEPRPDVQTPVYDPQHRRLLAAIAKHLNNLD